MHGLYKLQKERGPSKPLHCLPAAKDIVPGGRKQQRTLGFTQLLHRLLRGVLQRLQQAVRTVKE